MKVVKKKAAPFPYQERGNDWRSQYYHQHHSKRSKERMLPLVQLSSGSNLDSCAVVELARGHGGDAVQFFDTFVSLTFGSVAGSIGSFALW